MRKKAKARQIVQEPLAQTYARLVADIKDRIRSAQYDALKAVNKELIALYWDIGRLIVERQKGDSWGKAVVERLAADLRAEFPGVGGFSASNLWRMKLFFETYQPAEKLAPLVREIAWSHNLVILERCSDLLEREFYIRMTCKFGWSKNVLIHQIDNQSYEKTLLNQTNFDKAVTLAIRAQAKLAVKDEYTFDFLSHPQTTPPRIERPVAVNGSHQRITGGCEVKGYPEYGFAQNMVEILIV